MKLPTKALTNEELSNLAKQLKIPLLGVFMKDEIPKLNGDCCGIINFQTTHQLGSHWSCFYIKDGVKYYFDSFGETPPPALIKRLKTTQEIKNSTPVIRQSSVQVQQDNSTECGSLCHTDLSKKRLFFSGGSKKGNNNKRPRFTHHLEKRLLH